MAALTMITHVLKGLSLASCTPADVAVLEHTVVLIADMQV